MMAGTVVIERNGGSTSAPRCGVVIWCAGRCRARVGIDMKGGTIIIGGRAGAFCGS